jgi:hypothetical protein
MHPFRDSRTYADGTADDRIVAVIEDHELKMACRLR